MSLRVGEVMSAEWTRCEPYRLHDAGKTLAVLERCGRGWMVSVHPRDHRGRQSARRPIYCGFTHTLRTAHELAESELAEHEKAARRKVGIPEPEDRTHVALLHVPEAR